VAKKHGEMHFGLALPEAAREKLRKAGIFVQTAVTVEHQNLGHRYVVRGVESGGAVEGFGHYVTFAAEDGSRLPWLCRVESLAVNGPHAVVVAPVLVRAEILRAGSTYELLITRHRPAAAANRKRPTLESILLFRGRHGHLTNGRSGLPSFWTRGGEPQPVPAAFRDVVSTLVEASRCCGCEHSHYVAPPEEIAPEGGNGATEERSGTPGAQDVEQGPEVEETSGCA
jgi:hypothetical protein